MPSDLFESGVQTSIYLFEVGKQHKESDVVRFINFDNDGYKRNYRRKAKHNLIDKGDAKERYDDLVSTVLNGSSQSKYLKDSEHYVEDTIDPNNGNDWNFDKHVKFETNPNYHDFSYAAKNYMTWSIANIINSSHDYMDNFDNNDWKPIKASKLFDIEKVTGINKSSLTTPDRENIFDYVTRTSENRGILRTTGIAKPKDNGKPVKINHRGTYSLGLLQMTFFYRERDWYAGQFVRKIVPKFDIDSDIGLFFETLFNKQSRLLLSEIVSDVDDAFNNLTLLLPVDNSGHTDFDKIRSISQSLKNRISDYVTKSLNKIN